MSIEKKAIVEALSGDEERVQKLLSEMSYRELEALSRAAELLKETADEIMGEWS
jgi:hypothetical protein